MELNTCISIYENFIETICNKDIIEINNQISPSYWVKRMPTEDVINYHLEYMNKKNEKLKYVEIKTHSYGASEREKFDIISDPNLKRKEEYMFIFLHGGYWQALSKESYHWLAGPILDNGGLAAFIGYDLAPNAGIDKITEQVTTALEVILQNAEYMKIAQVYIGGHSAGAHLAFMGAINVRSDQLKKRLKGFWLVSGVHDLRPLALSCENKALKLTPLLSRALSPLNGTNISKFVEFYSKCDTHVWIGDSDPLLFKEQSLQLYRPPIYVNCFCRNFSTLARIGKFFTE